MLLMRNATCPALLRGRVGLPFAEYGPPRLAMMHRGGSDYSVPPLMLSHAYGRGMLHNNCKGVRYVEFLCAPVSGLPRPGLDARRACEAMVVVLRFLVSCEGNFYVGLICFERMQSV